MLFRELYIFVKCVKVDVIFRLELLYSCVLIVRIFFKSFLLDFKLLKEVLMVVIVEMVWV